MTGNQRGPGRRRPGGRIEPPSRTTRPRCGPPVTAIVVLGLCLLGLALLGPVVAADAESSEPTVEAVGNVEAVGDVGAIGDVAAVGEWEDFDEFEAADGTEAVEIDPALLEADGEVTVLVHFGAGVDASGVDVSGDVEAWQDQAATAQGPLLAYAVRTPGVTVERQFWIQNAAAVTVDADRLDVADLAAIEGVTALRENVVLSGADASLDGPAVTSDVTVDGPAVSPDEGEAGASALSSATVGEDEQEEPGVSWGLEVIGAPDVWESLDARGEGITVAVLDSGAEPSHPDVTIDGWGDWDVDGEPRDTDPLDYDVERQPSGHGTHVIGTVNGGTESGIHIGVAPEASVIAGAVLTDCDAGGCDATAAQILAGIEWALEHEADVITASVGLETKDQRFIEPIRRAQSEGTVVVASAGNEGFGSSTSPGNDFDSISVGAADTDGGIVEHSGGELVFPEAEWEDPPADWPELYVNPTLAAPGESIPSAIATDDGQYSRATGTSFAAPHVAGVVALLQSATADTLTPAEVETILVESAHRPVTTIEYPNVRYGHGIVNAANAAALALDGEYDPDAIEVGVPEGPQEAVPPEGALPGEGGDEGGYGDATTVDLSDYSDHSGAAAGDAADEPIGDDIDDATDDDGEGDGDSLTDEVPGFGALLGMLALLIVLLGAAIRGGRP